MGLRGPAPKPSVIEIAEGCPGKRAVNRREPQPHMIRPKMPKHLDQRARREWRRLAPLLERMRVLTEADGIALSALCADVSIMEQTQESISKSGLLTKNQKTGHIHQNPLLQVLATTTDRVMRGLREFGLTPAARSRLTTYSEASSDPLEAALCG